MLEHYSNKASTDKPLSGANAMVGGIQLPPQSSPSHDLDDLQPVACVEDALGKFRRRHRLAVVLHHDAAGQKLLRREEFLERARQVRRNGLAVGDDVICAHVNRLLNSLWVLSQVRKCQNEPTFQVTEDS